jgi:hypothetical protein
MAHWKTVSGIVVEGFRVASGAAQDSPYPRGTIEMQAPYFRALGLDLTPCHPATIGVSCRPLTFAVRNPEFTFRGVKWSPEHDAEDFSFSRCRITVGDAERDGLVYYPHPETKLGHFHDDSTLEILAPHIDGVYYGVEVRLEINTDEIDVVEHKP